MSGIVNIRDGLSGISVRDSKCQGWVIRDKYQG